MGLQCSSVGCDRWCKTSGFCTRNEVSARRAKAECEAAQELATAAGKHPLAKLKKPPSARQFCADQCRAWRINRQCYVGTPGQKPLTYYERGGLGLGFAAGIVKSAAYEFAGLGAFDER